MTLTRSTARVIVNHESSVSSVDEFGQQMTAGASAGRFIGRVVRAALLAIGLTCIFLIPTFLTHIGLGLVAPISSGYMTGRLRKLSGGEALAVAVILGLCVGLPVPIAQREVGFLSQLSTLAVVFFSAVVAVYYGALIGIAGWYGGHLARKEAAEFDGFLD